MEINQYMVKAKKTGSDEWIYGYYANQLDETLLFEPYPQGLMTHGVIGSSICRPTMLLDSEDNMIWENDLIKRENGLLWIVKFGEYTLLDTQGLSINCYGFYLQEVTHKKVKCIESILEVNLEVFEVIGNRFDNPELMEVR